jgi:AraC-like DNA-binding protein
MSSQKNTRKEIVIANTLKITVLLLPCLAGLFFFFANYKKPTVIYPRGLNEVGWESDKKYRNGKTETHFYDYQQDSVRLSFTLKMDKEQYPFCFIWFAPISIGYFDLSDYDYVDIEAKVDIDAKIDQPTTIPVQLQVEVPGYSNPGDPETYRIIRQEIRYDKNCKKYRLSLGEFTTPSWWWYNNPDLTKEKIGEPQYGKVTEIHIFNSTLLPMGVKEQLTIYSMTFRKSNSLLAWSMIICLASYGVLYMATRGVSTRQRALFIHKELKLGNVADEETAKLIDYIAGHYSDQEISLETVQRSLGMSGNKISALLKESFDMTFKKYVNQIRLQEARRLLKETDRQINDIADQIGYFNVTHFNRVFKESEGCSPNQYRKKTNAEG